MPSLPAPPPFSRREFLAGAGGVGAAMFLSGCTDGGGTATPPATSTPATSTPATSTPATAGATRPTGSDGVLVLVTLYGGNDALNTVVPIADPLYRQLRGSMAIDPNAALAIDDRFALHPSLVRTKQLWDTKQLAIVHGVGFDGLDRSHFHCMDVWQAGRTDELRTGWVGRWLDQVGSSPLDALGIGGGLPLLLRGARRSAAVVQPDTFALPGGPQLRSLVETLVAADATRPPLAAMAADTSRDLLSVIDAVGPLLNSPAAGSLSATTPGSPSPNYSANPLTAQLAAVAKIMASDLPTRIYSVGMDGFDTHTDQLATHAQLLTQLDAAVGEFFDAVGDADVTVAIYSEFGRRVQPNNSGTDHGAGGTVLLAGNVRAGHHGDPPLLDRLAEGDLTHTTDFRSVFGGLAESVLGVSSADLFGPQYRPLF